MLAMMLATIGRPLLILTNWARQCRRLHEVRPPTFAFWSSPPSRSSSASSRWSSPSSRSSSASSRWASLWSSSSIFWCDWSFKIHEPAGLKNCGWYSHCKVIQFLLLLAPPVLKNRQRRDDTVGTLVPYQIQFGADKLKGERRNRSGPEICFWCGRNSSCGENL